jgi:hypothetical protein
VTAKTTRISILWNKFRPIFSTQIQKKIIMSEAQFIPGEGAGNITGGLNAGMSMMERAQSIGLRNRQAAIQAAQDARAQQESELAQNRERALAPVYAIQDKYKIAKGTSDIAGLAQTEQLRLDAQTALPQARAAFDDIMRLGDPQERGKAAFEWTAKYGHLSNLAELHDEFSAKNSTAMNVLNHSQAMEVLGSRLKASDELVKQRGDNAVEVAKLRGDAAVEAARVRATASDKVERYRSSLAQAREAGDEEGTKLYSDLLSKATASPINTANGSDQMQQRLQAAIADGDPAEIAFWKKRITALTERGVRKGVGLDDPRAAALFGPPVSDPAATAIQSSTETKRIRVKLNELK